MASILDLFKRANNRGLKEFRFTLSEASEGTLVLRNSPNGWADSETTYTRHKTYHSVLRNTSTNELIFYKEARQFIQNVYENTGIDANITFTVEKLNKTTYTYEDYPSANKIDLSTYIVNETSVTVQLIDTEFKEKVINRDTTEVDLLKRISAEGLEMTPFTNRQIIMPDTSLDLSDTATFGGSLFNTAGEYAIISTAVTNTSFSELQVSTTNTPNKKTSSFFLESARPRIVRIQGSMNYDIWDGVSVDFRLVRINGSEVVQESTGLYSQSHSGSGIESVIFAIDEYVTLDTDDSLILQATFAGNRLIPDTTLTVSEIYTGSPRTIVRALPTYEAFLRAYQLTSDQEDCFKSDKFGRTDTPIITYGSDGELGYVTKGIYFRLTGSVSDGIPVKSKDLFQAYDNVFRLGMGVETDAGVTRVRIEERDYFYNATVILDLSSKLREQDIEKQTIADMFYKSCQFGWNKYEYEQNAGLFEFNTSSSWVTVIKSVFNDLKQVIKYRGDGQGMRKILNAPYSVDDNGDPDYDGTEDVKGDDDVFLIDAVRDGVDFIARTSEGFTSIGGSVYANSSFNIRYSPGRMLRTFGAEIKAGLLHSLNTYLRWQTTDKNNTLKSQLSTESYEVVENDDVLVNDLNESRYYNEKYVVKAPITTAQLQKIDANPNGLVKLSDTKYGWIMEMKTTNKDRMAEFELLRCNLNNVTPI